MPSHNLSSKQASMVLSTSLSPYAFFFVFFLFLTNQLRGANATNWTGVWNRAGTVSPLCIQSSWHGHNVLGCTWMSTVHVDTHRHDQMTTFWSLGRLRTCGTGYIFTLYKNWSVKKHQFTVLHAYLCHTISWPGPAAGCTTRESIEPTPQNVELFL